MRCKFKEKKEKITKESCKACSGECQFLEKNFDEDCEILKAFIDLDTKDIKTSK